MDRTTWRVYVIPIYYIYMLYMSMVIVSYLSWLYSVVEGGWKLIESLSATAMANGNVPITHPLPRTLQRNRLPAARTHTYGSKCVYIRTLSSDDRHAVCRRRRRLYLYNPDRGGIFFRCLDAKKNIASLVSLMDTSSWDFHCHFKRTLVNAFRFDTEIVSVNRMCVHQWIIF